MTIKECIVERTSQRSYLNIPLRREHRKQLEEFIAQHTDNPFNVNVRMKVVDHKSPAHKVKLGTYGVISGARTFIAGAMERTGNDMEGFGYCFERVVLFAQGLGLGTCWLGGTFSRGAFAQVMDLRENEIVPCVSPVGYPREKRTLRDTFTRYFAGSKNRKPWTEIFFNGNFQTALTAEAAGAYQDVLEMVRLAPSASNKQPWRILRNEDGFNFYLQHAGKALSAIFGFDMQKIDLGIAMYHFEAMAREKGLPGQWKQEPPGIKALDGQEKSLEYLFSWKSV
jgi:hypothetical protein